MRRYPAPWYRESMWLEPWQLNTGLKEITATCAKGRQDSAGNAKGDGEGH
jgi:hypothetical protein